jgi:type VI secretion system protein ImpC
MAGSFSFGKIDVAAGVAPGAAGEVRRDGPFRIAIFGDFSGRATRAISGPVNLRALQADRDNFDDLPAALGVELSNIITGVDNSPVSIPIKSIDDFHPDALYRSVEGFARLRKTRNNLGNPTSFEAAAAEVRKWGAASPAQPESKAADDPEQTPYSTEGLFDDTLSATTAEAAKKPAESLDWSEMIRSIAAPYALPQKSPQLAELVACVDAATSEGMRAILHHPRFQAVEAAWRGVQFLIRRLSDTDAELKIFLFDVSKDEIAADLAAEDLTKSALYKALVEQTVGTRGGEPWSLLVGLFTLDDTVADAELAGRFARIASAARAPLIAAAHDHHAGAQSLVATPDPDDWRYKSSAEASSAWTAVRGLAEAGSIGVALPRFLLRLPYGDRTDPIDSFHFDEAAGPDWHEQVLWGNPAIACALVIGRAFLADGWSFQPEDDLDIDELPLYVRKQDGETMCCPTAETVLSDRAAEAMRTRRLIPLIPYRDSDRLRVAGITSLAGKRLAGRWKS